MLVIRIIDFVQLMLYSWLAQSENNVRENKLYYYVLANKKKQKSKQNNKKQDK